MGSLRRNLVLGAALAVVVVFALLAVVLYASVRIWLLNEFDRGLSAEAETLAAATELHQGAVRMEEGEQAAAFRGGREAHYFELWHGERPIARSASLQGRDLIPPPATLAGHVFQFLILPDGRLGRQVAIPVTPRNEDDESSSRAISGTAAVRLIVARDTVHLTGALSRLRWLLAAACGTAVLVSAGLLTAIIRRGLSPIGQIADRIERVGRRNLSDRLDARRTPQELLPIVHRLNDLLERIESAFGRERAFAANVAHELRTPLAGLAAAMEVAGSRTRDPKEYQEVLANCLQTTWRMHAMVETLLSLARAESGLAPLAPTRFSLCQLIDQTWEPFASRATARDLSVTRDCGMDREMITDREKLQLVLHNLFDNAVSHADHGGRIRLNVASHPAGLQLTIANTGSRLTPEMTGQVFERFWRGDAARSDTGDHCGLGLSITRQLVTLLGGTINVESTSNGEFIARLLIEDTKRA